jgi:hypothetical protein
VRARVRSSVYKSPSEEAQAWRRERIWPVFLVFWSWFFWFLVGVNRTISNKGTLKLLAHLGGGNHFHAAGHSKRRHVLAQGTRFIEEGAIPKRGGAGLPASARRAAIKLADRMEKLMSGILLPVGGFSAAGDDDAVAQAFGARGQWNRGGEMHKKRDGANNPRGLVNQPDQSAQVGFSAEVEHPLEGRMVVTGLADLHEAYAPPKLINDLLPPSSMPPFDGKIVFATSDDDPIRTRVMDKFLNRAGPILFFPAQMDVPPEFGGFDAQAQMVV